jgi:P-type E1-E2 ATPase
VRLGTPEWVAAVLPRSLVLPGIKADGEKSVWLAMGDRLVGSFELEERLREGVEGLFPHFQSMGIRCTVLTGDPHPQWKDFPGAVLRFGLSPEQKAALVAQSALAGEHPVFVGDGINDLNAMQAASASVAIQDGGADLTRSSASALLAGTHLPVLLQALRLARKVESVLRGNLRIAVFYNALGMGCAAMGWLNPVLAAILMVVSSLVVTFRAVRVAESWSRW